VDAFALIAPERGPTAVLVEVPHASIALPPELRDEITAPAECLWRDADLHVAELYRSAPAHGATLLAARYSRYVVDLNRAPDDVDAQTVPDHPSPRAHQPRGVVWRITTDGRPSLKAPLSYAALGDRLLRYHAPYHAALAAELERLRRRFGFVVLVAGHSMPSVGRAGHSDPGARRADVVPGTRGRATADARVIDLVDAHFRAAGLSVRHDDPYQGGYTTQHYGRPRERCHAVQIELNRAIYMNEETGELRDRDAARVRSLLDELVTKLGRLDLR